MATDTKEALATLGQAVATYLGPEWKASYEKLHGWKDVARLVREDGAALTLHVIEGRVRVSGEYLRGYTSYPTRIKDITIAVERGPEVIAREIKSRLLPSYLLIYAKDVEELKAAQKAEAELQQVLVHLATIVKEPPKGDVIYLSVPWADTTKSPEWHPSNLHGTVKLSSSSYGEFNVEYCPTALLAQLLQVFQNYRTSPQGTARR